jgi:nitric oxide reductase NorE protein
MPRDDVTPNVNAQSTVRQANPPGSDGVWTFVFMDMVIFMMMFFSFMIERRGHLELFNVSQLHLNELFGLANALILLTSSWMMVEAVQASRSRKAKQAERYLGLALLLGLAFAVNKLAEYYLKLRAGITPATNSFYSFYFFITFVHFLHVVAGMICIAYCRRVAVPRAHSVSRHAGLENVGLFWHFVDVLWIFIFPLLYLVGRQ